MGGAFRTAIGSTVTVLLLAAAGVAGLQSAASATVDPEVWVGAPYNGNWTSSQYCPAPYPSDLCSEPQYHHVEYAGLAGLSTGRAWATDIGNVPAGTAVKLYAAPQVSTMTITAKVQAVTYACADHVLAHGGYVVVIGIYNGATKIGYVAYAHVNPAVSSGEVINRWGTTIGTVGSYSRNGCWTGVHTHIELGNVHNYACFNKGWNPGIPWGSHMNATNFIGFIGGDRTSGPRQACP
jgi:hypothetical protein